MRSCPVALRPHLNLLCVLCLSRRGTSAWRFALSLLPPPGTHPPISGMGGGLSLFGGRDVRLLVAGLDAGRTYTDWPLMMGEQVPSGYVEADLGVRSLFEGRAATQFNHRILAYAIWFASLGLAALSWGRAGWREAATLAVLVTLQAAWGILTLISAAPLEMAILHQALGVVVFVMAVRLAWLTRPSEAR